MRNTCKFLLTSTLGVVAPAILLFSCSASDRTDPGPSPGSFNFNADELKSFEDWKATLIKSCDSDSAFAGKKDGEGIGFDARNFLKKTGNSLSIKGGDGRFVLLGEPSGYPGRSESTLTRSETINGDHKEFAAKVIREGQSCKVEVSGQVIYETEIWSALPVVVFGEGNIAAPAELKTAFQAEHAILRHGLTEAFTKAAARRKPLLAFLKAQFADLSDDRLDRLFPSGELKDGSHAVILSNYTHAPVIDRSRPQIDGPDGMMLDLTKLDGSTLLDVVIRPARVKFADISNDTDVGIWHVSSDVSWTSLALNVRSYKVGSLTLEQMESPDPERFGKCVFGRDEAFSGSTIYGDGQFAPSYPGLVGPCAVFTEDLGASIDGYDVLRKRIGNKFAGVKGAKDLHLNGWNEALKLLAKYYLTHIQSVQARLDPEKKSPLIEDIERYTKIVSSLYASREPLLKDGDLLLTKLAFVWAFSGETIADAAIEKYLHALANTRALLPTSTDTWIEDLSKAPNDQDLRATYAISISGKVKQSIVALRSKADALTVRADVESIKLDNMVQDQPQFDLIAKWIANLDALAAFKVRDAAKATGANGLSFDSDFKELARAAIAEDWTDGDLKQVEVLVDVGRYSSSCENFGPVSSLARCEGRDSFTKKPKGLLDPSFGNRYGNLAQQLGKRLNALSDFDFISDRSNLSRAFYKPVWKGCDAQAFQTKSQKLDSLLGQLAGSEFTTRFQTQSQIRDLLDECAG